MRKTIFPILLCVCVLALSCKDKVVCPAFQSTYILDDSIRNNYYSYFSNDSTPKYPVYAKRRTKNGINKKFTLFQKNYELMTAPKKNVLGPPRKDTLNISIDEGEFLASDFVDQDSTATDSLQLQALYAFADQKPKEAKYKWEYDTRLPYNHEQEYYNKYYGQLFIDDRPEKTALELMEEESAAGTESDSTVTKKKKFGFGKKNKDKKPKEGSEESPKPTDEAAPTKEEDDGFGDGNEEKKEGNDDGNDGNN